MLELSMQIVLANAHNLLNKREYVEIIIEDRNTGSIQACSDTVYWMSLMFSADGVMTSYQMKTTTPVTLTTDKPEVKDPFSDLDPLWQLKSKNWNWSIIFG